MRRSIITLLAPLLLATGCETLKNATRDAIDGVTGATNADATAADGPTEGSEVAGNGNPPSSSSSSSDPASASDPGSESSASPSSPSSPSNPSNPSGPSSSPVVANTKASVQTGSVRWGWTDAKVGWYLRARTQGGVEMISEVVEADDDLLLMESRMRMNGQEMNASRMWQARLFPDMKGEGAAETEYEVETVELADETLSIGGESVDCAVTKTIIRGGGMDSTSITWMSDDVPGGLVKTETDSGGAGSQVAYEVVEFRR